MWLLSDKIYFDLKAFILGRQPCYQSSLFTFFLDAVSISELLDKLVLFLFYYSTWEQVSKEESMLQGIDPQDGHKLPIR